MERFLTQVEQEAGALGATAETVINLRLMAEAEAAQIEADARIKSVRKTT